MKYAINLNSLLPIRRQPSEASELETQLLFGESCEVFEEENSFIRIKNTIDGYEGWADKKMLTEISLSDYNSLQHISVYRICVPVADVFSLSDKTIYRLTAGSLLPNYNADNNRFGTGDCMFQVHPSFVTHLPDGQTNKEGIVPIAMHFLNTPYLWGGKSVFGIDCSGFVQTIFALNGFSLPRNSSNQAQTGKEITFDKAEAGDLLFFSKNDKITHVGIYFGNGKIIHASGRVKIDNVDSTGIAHADNSLTYTHYLSAIRRI